MYKLAGLVFSFLAFALIALALNSGTVQAQGFTGAGRYRIEIVANGKVLDLRMEDKRSVQQWTAGGARNQQWDIVDAGNGYYFITSVENGLVLDIEGGRNRDGSAIITSVRGNSENQRWKITDIGRGEYSIISKAGKSLESPAGKREDGVKLQIWGAHGLENQRFRLTRIGEIEANLLPGDVVTPKAPFAGKGRYEIQVVASGLFLDLKREDNTTLQQWSGSGARNQQWDFEDAGDGYFYIRSVVSGLVLEAGGPRDRSAVVAKAQKTGSKNQMWRIVDAGNGQSLIISKNRKALELPNAPGKEGQVFRISNESRRDNQRFTFKKVETIERFTGGRTRQTRFPATQPEPQPAPYTPGRMNWRGRVDMEILLEVQASTVIEKTVAGRSFNNGRYNFTAAMPARELSLRIENKTVRGSVELIEQPSAANGYKAVIRIRDPQSSSADYEFDLIW